MSAWIELTVKYHRLPGLTFVIVIWLSQKVGTCVNEISAYVLRILGASCGFTPSQAPPEVLLSHVIRLRILSSAGLQLLSSHGFRQLVYCF
jgi:hypothetical protein